MKKPRIFISYSSKDRTIVEKLHQRLLNIDNLYVWRDQERLETDWSREIAFALADSDVLCLMWSESAAASKWVKHEWLTARALEKRIIPILFPDAPKLPEPLHNLHGIHLKKSDSKVSCQNLIDRLREGKPFTEPYDYKVLPTNSYIPFNPNPEFTGRHIDLLELYLKMIGNLNKIGINQVGAVGMGGVGKTQLAVEFAYRFSYAFDSVYWIQAAEVEQWRSELVKLARDRLQLSISDPDKPQADQRYIFKLQKYFKDHPQALIIMDNVIEPKLLNNDTFLDGFPPLSLGCNLLFTTRQHFSLKGVTSHAVDVLSPESAYMLLTHDRKPTTPEEDDHARTICIAVGYLPLAIILAAGYLNEYTDVSFSDYQAELIKNKLDVIDIGELSEEELATRHVAAVGITLEEDWKKITNKNSRLLFQLASQFREAEIIPKARLGLMAGIASRKGKLHRPLDKAINLLHSLSLIEKMESGGRAVHLHPLVRDFAKKKVPKNRQEEFRVNAAENLRTTYFDYPRLENELKTRGVGETIADLQIAIDWIGKGAEELQDLRLLQNTLRLSLNQLTRDPRQLAPHLISRSKYINTPQFIKLLCDATENQNGPWFNPICCSLTPPGGPLIRTFEGHSESVTAVEISPDGKTAVSGSSDGTLKLWNLSSGKILHSLEGHRSIVTAMEISPDGKTAISGSRDRTLKLWDLSSGKVLHTLEGHSDEVLVVAISPDNKTAVSGSWDGTLKLWDLSSGQALHTFEGHSDVVTTVAISPDGKTAVSGSNDMTLKLWDLSSGQALHTLEGHSKLVKTLAISPDGEAAISGSDDHTLKLWDLGTGEVLRTFYGHSGKVTAVAISPDGKTAVSGSWDVTLKLWDLSSGQALHTFEGHSNVVTAVAISPDGKTAVSGSNDMTLKLWDLSSGQALHTLEGHSNQVNAVAISPDGKTAVSGSWDNTLKLWDLSSGKALHTLEGHNYEVNALAISPDGKIAISGSWDGTLKLWDLSSGKGLHTLEGHSESVTAVAISPDSMTAVSGSWDGTLKLWDLSSGQALHKLEGHSDEVLVVAISPDSKTAVSGSWDGTLKLWDLSSGKALHTLEGQNYAVNGVVINPDGKTAVSVSNDMALKLWDLSSGKAFFTIEGHKQSIEVVAISPDGKTAVSSSWDGTNTLDLWDLSSGKVLHILEGHSDAVTAVAISSDGKTAVSGSRDTTLKLWDLSSGKVIASFISESRN